LFDILEYATPLVVLYLHVAFSFVVSEIVVDVVPALSVPVGEPELLVGAAVSEGIPTNPFSI
jgi:hypothetical protein